MIRSMYSGISGMKNQQIKMDVIGNNIANVGTTAFKGSRVTFKDALTQTTQAASAPTTEVGGLNPRQIGLGMAVSSIDRDMTGGTNAPTGRSTDFAIEGSGYFVVESGGETFYTRDGSFTLDRYGDLVTSSGLRVIGQYKDENGINTTGPINIPLEHDTVPSIKIGSGGKEILSVKLLGFDGGDSIKDISITASSSSGKSPIYYSKEDKRINIDIGAYSNLTELERAITNQLKSIKELNKYDEDPETGELTPLGEQQKLIKENIIDKGVSTIVVTGDLNQAKESTKATSAKLENQTIGGVEGFTIDAGLNNGYLGNFKVVFEKVAKGTKSSVEFDDKKNLVIKLEDGEKFDASKINKLIEDKIAAATPKTTKAAFGDNLPNEKIDMSLFKISGTGEIDASKLPETGKGESFTLKGGTGLAARVDEQPIGTNKFSFNAGIENGSAGNLKIEIKSGDVSPSTAEFDSNGKLIITLDKTKTDIKAADIENLIKNAKNKPSNVDLSKFTVTPADSNNDKIDASGISNSIDIELSGGVSGGDLSVMQDSRPDKDSNTGFRIEKIQLNSFSVGKDGNIKCTYGVDSFDVGRFQLARFVNDAGLEAAGGNLYRSTSNSGQPATGFPNDTGFGTTEQGYLEMSNVDLANEFTDMIVTSRSYQANSRTITTSDEMRQELLNLKR